MRLHYYFLSSIREIKRRRSYVGGARVFGGIIANYSRAIKHKLNRIHVTYTILRYDSVGYAFGNNRH